MPCYLNVFFAQLPVCWVFFTTFSGVARTGSRMGGGGGCSSRIWAFHARVKMDERRIWAFHENHPRTKGVLEPPGYIPNLPSCVSLDFVSLYSRCLCLRCMCMPICSSLQVFISFARNQTSEDNEESDASSSQLSNSVSSDSFFLSPTPRQPSRLRVNSNESGE